MAIYFRKSLLIFFLKKNILIHIEFLHLEILISSTGNLGIFLCMSSMINLSNHMKGAVFKQDNKYTINVLRNIAIFISTLNAIIYFRGHTFIFYIYSTKFPTDFLFISCIDAYYNIFI